MSYYDALASEINTVLDRLADEGREWRAARIASEICTRHMEGLGDGEHTHFWLHCGYADCRREVTRAINRRAGDRVSEDSGQMALPGFKHLHAYYVVKRDGEDVGVSVFELTEHELARKEAHYRSMGAACYEHASELGRFRRDREAAS